MPTIIRFKNVRFVIYPNDHAPSHVHAIGKDAEAKISLIDFKAYYSRGFNGAALSALEDFVKENAEILKDAWREYHE